MKCNQTDCQNEARYRFTWPSTGESVICEEHLPKLIAVGKALDIHIGIGPVSGDEFASSCLVCTKEVERSTSATITLRSTSGLFQEFTLCIPCSQKWIFGAGELLGSMLDEAAK